MEDPFRNRFKGRSHSLPSVGFFWPKKISLRLFSAVHKVQHIMYPLQTPARQNSPDLNVSGPDKTPLKILTKTVENPENDSILSEG